jgi:hypothetical protein
MRRCDSAAMAPKTSEDLPDPDTPVKTVSRRLGISSETLARLFTLAPRTSITSWLSAVVEACWRWSAGSARIPSLRSKGLCCKELDRRRYFTA